MKGKSETVLGQAIGGLRGALINVGVFSFAINLMMLTAPLYMLQIYDRVLASRSEPTLLYLTLFAAIALGTMAALELVRSRILVRTGAALDSVLADRVFSMVLYSGANGQALRDMDTLRTFLSGAGMLTLLDAPWTPLFLALVYLLHPMLGHVALAGTLTLFTLGWVNEYSTRKLLAEAGGKISASTGFAEMSARNSEVVRAMGMLPGLRAVWRKVHDQGLGLQSLASDRAGIIAAAAKFTRFFLQVAILGVGAYLVIAQEITAGVMIASSIIMGRALAPVESAIGSWRGFLLARSAYGRLAEGLDHAGAEADTMPLPAPLGHLMAENLCGVPPGAHKPVITGLSFSLQAGTSLGITGPSAAGKSSLARLLVGVWRPTSGQVRLDNVNIWDWRREEVGPYIGYLPQDIELFHGTVADNIARFGQVEPSRVVEAAKLAGTHTMILELPNGYDTVIGNGGNNLSGGQRQRIGLARAFYGIPPLIVLDEPSSNLDAEGEAAVRQGVEELKRMGKTVVIIAHQPAVLGGTDMLMVIQKGSITSFGPTAQIMSQITRRSLGRAEPELSTVAKG